MWPFTQKKRAATETGAQNAERFVRTVTALAHKERCIEMYPQTRTVRGMDPRRFGWVWMVNPAWRTRVWALLKNAPVRDAKFMEPDVFDGWTFIAFSTVPTPYISQLSLDDTLEGNDHVHQ